MLHIVHTSQSPGGGERARGRDGVVVKAHSGDDGVRVQVAEGKVCITRVMAAECMNDRRR